MRAGIGAPIMRYLITLRLAVAAQLLLEPRPTIKEVARISGYPDVRHCMTLFPRRAGGTTHLQHGLPAGREHPT